MRRADRLFQIVQILSRRRLTTAAVLAERLEVSERTVYRDVADLVRSGVPIRGEAGVGYALSKDFELPPMMLDVEEIQALVLGARMVERFGDGPLRLAARRVLDKVEGVLPPSRRQLVGETSLFALAEGLPEPHQARLEGLRGAVDRRKRVQLRYADAKGSITEREVLPLGLYFWGPTWSLAAWCELRGDYRNFRLDRIVDFQVDDASFERVSPHTIEEYVAAMRAQIQRARADDDGA